MNPKVKEVLDTILDQFKNSDNIPEIGRLVILPSYHSSDEQMVFT